MKITWKKTGWVEGQMFEPDNGSRNLILLCPGYPGMGATLFEQCHAAALVEQGFAVMVLRHKGMKLNSGIAPAMINNAARLYEARQKNEIHLGGGQATIQEWLIEPLLMLQEISKSYDSIHIIGNSFGALSALWSLTEENAPIQNIKSIILLAGAQGIDDGTDTCVMRIWKPEYMLMPRITDKVNLEDPLKDVVTLKHTYKLLPRRVLERLPESILITYIVVHNDELLHLPDTGAFRAAINGRGNIMIETTCRAWPEFGLLAHDTANLPTEYLLNILRKEMLC